MAVRRQLETLSDLRRRDALASRVCARLRRDQRVVAVEAYGSLARGGADRYSDIDLVVRVRGQSDRAFAEAVPDLLDPLGPRLIDGWGLALLPETYVRTFYFADYPLFWSVDIGCRSDEHVDGSDVAGAYHWPQIFKMWITTVRAWCRGDDRTAQFSAHISRWADVGGLSGRPVERLGQMLDLCVARARQRGAPCEAVYERCVELRRRYLAMPPVNTTHGRPE